MNLKIDQSASRVIVYDADCVKQPSPDMFEEAYWREKGAIRQTAKGRGNTLMLDTPFGAAVMRRYLRGGWAAHLSHDRYLFTGYARSRPVREARMLADLVTAGLPVPRPMAAQCLRHGITCSGVLITREIEHARTLADAATEGETDSEVWRAVGRCIRRFHVAGVVHPDLNARNILVNVGGGGVAIHLIDFDRARFQTGELRPFRDSLQRLHRSLVKFWPNASASMLETCWAELMSGYNAG